jgi:hypothetical protein
MAPCTSSGDEPDPDEVNVKMQHVGLKWDYDARLALFTNKYPMMDADMIRNLAAGDMNIRACCGIGSPPRFSQLCRMPSASTLLYRYSACFRVISFAVTMPE